MMNPLRTGFRRTPESPPPRNFSLLWTEDLENELRSKGALYEMVCAGWTLAFPPMAFRQEEGVRYLLVLLPPELSLAANVHLTLNQRIWSRRRDFLEAALLSGVAAGATLFLFVLPLLWLWRY